MSEPTDAGAANPSLRVIAPRQASRQFMMHFVDALPANGPERPWTLVFDVDGIVEAAAARRPDDFIVYLPNRFVVDPRVFAFEDGLPVDAILVAHSGVARLLTEGGVDPDKIEVLGPWAPTVETIAAERSESTPDAGASEAPASPEGPVSSAGDDDQSEDESLVLITQSAVEELGLTHLLVQLSLVSSPVTFLFEVGQDEALANQLRRLVASYDISAMMFSRDADGAETDPGPTAGFEIYRRAALMLVDVASEDVVLGLGAGAGLLLMPERAAIFRAASGFLQRSGVAEAVSAVSTLAVAIERSIEPERISTMRTAVSDLDIPGAPARCGALVASLQSRSAEPVSPSASRSGLPEGLERLSTRSLRRRPAVGPAKTAASEDSVAEASVEAAQAQPGSQKDEDAKIEAELEALRKRLSSS